jgi:hypothetical protein
MEKTILDTHYPFIKHMGVHASFNSPTLHFALMTLIIQGHPFSLIFFSLISQVRH